jgi:hypothetical protein
MYPGVSSRVLAMFHCIEVEGVSYLAADTSLQCDDSQYQSYLPLALIGTLLFPIAIPLSFFILLHRYRFRRNDHSVAWLDFLRAAYSQRLSYFELVDMAEKLFLSSLLVFVSPTSRLQVGLACVAIYMVIILQYTPYLHPNNDTLQLLVQTELFCLLLAAHTLQQNEDTALLMDFVLSIVLLIITCAAIALFIYYAIQHVKRSYWNMIRTSQQSKETAAIAEMTRGAERSSPPKPGSYSPPKHSETFTG